MNDSEIKDDVTPKPEKTTISDDMLIIVPVRNLVLFPGTVVPVAINRERSLAAAQEAVRAERKVGFVLQHDPDLQSPTGRDLYKVGTVASIVRCTEVAYWKAPPNIAAPSWANLQACDSSSILVILWSRF